MILMVENRSSVLKTCPIATLSNINPTRTSLGLYLGLHGDRPVTNCVKNGMAWLYCNVQLVSFSRLYMATWNVATRHPEEDLAGMLGFGTSGRQKVQERLPDFFVIG
jgi:hypothetical protein